MTGAETHAGPAPMEGRRDALRAAAALLEDIYQIAHRHAPHGRATVGEFQAYPGLAQHGAGPGALHGRPAPSGRRRRWTRWTTRCARCSSARAAAMPAGSSFGVEQIWYAPPVAFDPACIARCAQAAPTLGLSAREIVSGAGHDAVYMARVVPTAMIFVPCKDGISHNEAEYASPEACADGANVLLHAVLARADA